MTRFQWSVFIILLAVGGADRVAAASFFASATDAVGCELVENSLTGASAVCAGAVTSTGSEVRAAAFAEPGRLSVLATAGSELFELGRPGAEGRARATAQFSDTLTFGIESGSIALPIDLMGSVSISPASMAALSGQSQATFEAQIGDAFFRRNIVYLVGPDGEPFLFADEFDSNAPGASLDGVTTIFASFSGGSLTLNGVASASVSCGSAFEGACRADVAFGDSLRLLGATVFDPDGNPVETTIVSSSGFDYLTGFAPHDRVSAVPLPPAALSLLAGLAALAGLARRRVTPPSALR